MGCATEVAAIGFAHYFFEILSSERNYQELEEITSRNNHNISFLKVIFGNS